MPNPLGPDPGFAFTEGNAQAGAVWISEAIRIVNRKIPAQADSTATTVVDLRADFNDFLQKLRDLGLMEE